MKLATIAHLLPDHNPFPPVYPAGTELRVEQVARRQRRYRPVVICKAFDDQVLSEQIDAMQVRRIRIGRLYRRVFQKLTRLNPWPYAARMWRVAQQEQAVLLHIHNEPKLLAGLQRQLQVQPMPVVVHVANEKLIEKQALTLVTHWVACSHYIAGWLQHDNGIAADRISVIHTGVDTQGRQALWDIPAAQRQALRERYGITDPHSLVLLFAGRLVQEKGVQELLDAFVLLRQQLGTQVQLLVAGNVRDSNDPNNQKAVYGKAVTARMQQMAGVSWVGSLHPAQMHEFLLAGDLFVMPSLWPDPYPTVMLEAAAAGLPIVAAARGGITEFLQGCPGLGFVDDPADPQQLQAAMQAWLQAPDLRQQAGRWLRQRIEQEFDWSRVCEDFEQLYDRLLARQNPGP